MVGGHATRDRKGVVVRAPEIPKKNEKTLKGDGWLEGMLLE